MPPWTSLIEFLCILLALLLPNIECLFHITTATAANRERPIKTPKAIKNPLDDDDDD